MSSAFLLTVYEKKDLENAKIIIGYKRQNSENEISDEQGHTPANILLYKTCASLALGATLGNLAYFSSSLISKTLDILPYMNSQFKNILLGVGMLYGYAHYQKYASSYDVFPSPDAKRFNPDISKLAVMGYLLCAGFTSMNVSR